MRIHSLGVEAKQLEDVLKNTLDEATWKKVDDITRDQAQRVADKNKMTKEKKLQRLARGPEGTSSRKNNHPPSKNLKNSLRTTTGSRHGASEIRGPERGRLIQSGGEDERAGQGASPKVAELIARFEELSDEGTPTKRPLAASRGNDTSSRGLHQSATPVETKNLIGPATILKKRIKKGPPGGGAIMQMKLSKELPMEKTSSSTSYKEDLNLRGGGDEREQTEARPRRDGWRRPTVINRSDTQLTDTEMAVLEKGFNFAVTPARLPTEELVTNIETALSDIDEETARRLRLETAYLLLHARLPKPNLTREEMKALKELKANDRLVITRADKGNATVVMNRSEYVEKMEALLDPATYERGIKDPTKKIENKITKLVKNSALDEGLKKSLLPDDSRTPRIYGLPKIHKKDVPLRPIVSMIGAPTYKPAKVLAKLLGQHTGGTFSKVKNSTHLTEILKDITLDENDMLASLDIESLFTNIPVNDSINIIKEHGWLEEPLLKICEEVLTSCYFQFQDVVYKQRDGVAMGSPLSSVVADLFMEEFETRAIDEWPEKPKLWLRYVDDILILWPHGKEKLQEFRDFLNSRHRSIRFTIEEEVDGRLPFLDLLLIKSEGGRIEHTVYRKPTATGRYLQAGSHHPGVQKNGIVYTLVNRAVRLCSNENLLEKEIDILKGELAANGYTRRSVEKALKKALRKKETAPETGDEEERRSPLAVIPYVGGVSEKICRIMKKGDIRTVYRPHTKIEHLLPRPKDKQWMQDKGVYLIPCDCGQVYVGQTGKKASTRLSQHLADYKFLRTKTSAVARHGTVCGKQLKFDEARMLAREENLPRRLLREAIEIYKHPSNMNSGEGCPLPDVWKSVIRREKQGPMGAGDGRLRLDGNRFKRRASEGGTIKVP